MITSSRRHRQTDRLRDRIALGAGCAVAAVLLAACGSGGSSTGVTPGSTVTSTVTASAPVDATTPPAAPSATPSSPPTTDADVDVAGPTTCPPDIGTAALVSRDAARIAPPRPSASWHAANRGGTFCNGLSYIYIVGPIGLPTEPKQLLIYHDGTFQGTGIRCNVRYQEVSIPDPDAISVVYRYDVPGEPSQSPAGEADVTFRWNGSRVVMEGTVPAPVTRGAC